ncbi:S66 family peptidase [Rummeliibacillus suwonensis]|uniref:S66 family peptidase n=1 Tax=Rummeliibacillus suwonensis TaxID=1306154 RepID=UPI0028989565|nr:LD-carboxypeptidase [Rummeliibacillus suwonensis]
MFQPLGKGDTVGVFSPSKPASVTAFERYVRGKERLQSLGLKVKEGILTGKEDYYRSGTPKERAEELNALLLDQEVKMIMPSMGGTNANSILPYIDYEAFRKNPKMIVGLSDVTAILLALYRKTGIPVFYGPSVASTLGEFPPLIDDTMHYFQAMFMEKQKTPYIVPMPEQWSDEKVNWLEKTIEKKLYRNKWICVQKGIAQGRLVGGNVNTMYGTIGTEYFPIIEEGDLLLIEDTTKTAAIVEKNFAMLKLHGILDKVSGIILGKHEQYDDLGTGRKPYEILLEQLDGRDIPILADFDSCHTHPLHSMPLGRQVELNATEKKVILVENWF